MGCRRHLGLLREGRSGTRRMQALTGTEASPGGAGEPADSGPHAISWRPLPASQWTSTLAGYLLSSQGSGAPSALGPLLALPQRAEKRHQDLLPRANPVWSPFLTLQPTNSWGPEARGGGGGGRELEGRRGGGVPKDQRLAREAGAAASRGFTHTQHSPGWARLAR